jgi:Protein of unknown function (DUF2752)
MDLGEAAGAGTGYDAVESGRAVLERGRRHISREGEILAGGVIILAGSFVYPYIQGFATHVTPGCIFHRITGLPCLLCGMTRSMVATAHGRLGEAFRFHLLGPPLFAVIAVVIIALSLEFAMGRPILPRLDRRGRMLLGWGVLGLLVAAWVARLAFFGINV